MRIPRILEYDPFYYDPKPIKVSGFVEDIKWNKSMTNKTSKYYVRGIWATAGFEDSADAIRAAQIASHKQQEDIAIYKIDSVVKFPLDDYKVVKA